MSTTIYSWEHFEPVVLKTAGEVSAAFVQVGALDYRTAARFVSRVPYGRNTIISDPLIVLREHRGTCSTKHALLRRLAMEQGLDVALVLGIYKMNQLNTPGVGPVLERYGLAALPEAHCYLRFQGHRIDVTRETGTLSAGSIAQFLHEEEISPEQIGTYKANFHRRFLQRWLAETDTSGRRSLDEIWRIREECISALSQ
jgi:hypothetical protein